MELIHEDVRKASLELSSKRLIVAQQIARFDEEVEKVEPAPFRFRFLIAVDDLAELVL